MKKNEERMKMLKDAFFAFVVIPWWGLKTMVRDHYESKRK